MIHYIFSVENKSYLQAEENLTNICSANNPGERLLQELRMENIAYVLHSAFDQAADSLFPLNFSNGKVKLFFSNPCLEMCSSQEQSSRIQRGNWHEHKHSKNLYCAKEIINFHSSEWTLHMPHYDVETIDAYIYSVYV